MSFKSGFTNEHSTVRDVMAPGPLREACGFHYQEFTNLAEPKHRIPDRYKVGEQNTASVWEEFIGLLAGIRSLPIHHYKWRAHSGRTRQVFG